MNLPIITRRATYHLTSPPSGYQRRNRQLSGWWTLKLLLAAWLGGFSAAAQSLRLAGQVTNAATGAPVTYASVGVVGKPIGATADAQGQFAFTVASGLLVPTEQVIVSCVGFEAQPRRVSDFAAGPVQVALAASQVALAEVEVKRSGRSVARRFGFRGEGRSYQHVQWVAGEPPAAGQARAEDPPPTACLFVSGVWPARRHSYVYRAASQAPWNTRHRFWRGTLSFYTETTSYQHH